MKRYIVPGSREEFKAQQRRVGVAVERKRLRELMDEANRDLDHARRLVGETHAEIERLVTEYR